MDTLVLNALVGTQNVADGVRLNPGHILVNHVNSSDPVSKLVGTLTDLSLILQLLEVVEFQRLPLGFWNIPTGTN